jgi:putative membrane protein
VERARKINAAQNRVPTEVTDFLIEAVDARMMDLAQGRLAKERGTTAAIREYGDLMINDQTRLLNELKIIAASKEIVLPSTISRKKEDALAELRDEEGEAFDEKFIRMMITDHRRDVSKFRTATSFDDGDVKTFATNNLPLIQSHLNKIEALEKK